MSDAPETHEEHADDHGAHDSHGHEEHGHDDHGHGHDDHGHGGHESLEEKLAKAAREVGKKATDEFAVLQATAMSDILSKAKTQYHASSTLEAARALKDHEWKIKGAKDVFKNIQYTMLREKSPKLLEAYEGILNAAKSSHDPLKTAELEAEADAIQNAASYITGVNYKQLGALVDRAGANPYIFQQIGQEWVKNRAGAMQSAYLRKLDIKKVDSQLEKMLKEQFPDAVDMSTIKDLNEYQKPEDRIGLFLEYIGAKEEGSYKKFKDEHKYLFKKAAAHGHDDHGAAAHH